MKKKFTIMMLALFLCVANICAGCGKQKEALHESDNSIASSSSITAQQKNNNDITLYWLVDSGYTERMGKKVFEQFNQKLNEKGYDFQVQFVGKDSTEYKSYQKYINQAHNQKGKIDILFTGYGVDGEKDTYDVNIENNNLVDLSSYLKTKSGRSLKRSFNKKMWEKMTFDNKIYGIYNAKELSSTYYLLANKKYFKEKQNINSFDPEQLKKMAEEIRCDSDDVCFYLPNAERYEICGYEKNVKNHLYYSHKSNKSIEDIALEEPIKQVNDFIKEGSRNKWLCTSNEGLDKVYSGNFAMAIMDSYCSMIHDDKFVIDGKTIDVYAYPLVSKYIPIENNAVTGIASWSKHKEQAMELLCAVNTDPELSNILQYGVLNEDYQLVNGCVTGDISPSQISPSCPANQVITYPYAAEKQDKQKMYQEVNKKYQLFPKK